MLDITSLIILKSAKPISVDDYPFGIPVAQRSSKINSSNPGYIEYIDVLTVEARTVRQENDSSMFREKQVARMFMMYLYGDWIAPLTTLRELIYAGEREKAVKKVDQLLDCIQGRK